MEVATNGCQGGTLERKRKDCDGMGLKGGWDGTGNGTQEHRNTSRHDGVGGPDMAEASRLPEVAKEMKRLPQAMPKPGPGFSTGFHTSFQRQNFELPVYDPFRYIYMFIYIYTKGITRFTRTLRSIQ